MLPRHSSKDTPMMQQYGAIRSDLPEDTLLFFRLGDFYELFDDDAQEGARILGITLTHRHGRPMAGVPYHAADTYIPKLLASGKKVAICDQIEPPQPGKGIVKRALTRILTPGTTLDAHQVDAQRSHFLLALTCSADRALHAAWLDLTTGDFQIASDPLPENLLPVLTALDPREIILPDTALDTWGRNENLVAWNEAFKRLADKRSISKIPDYRFDPASGVQTVTKTLGVHNLDGFGLRADHPALGPAGALISYATESLRTPPRNLYRIREYRSTATLLLDPATLRHLEIFKSSANTRQRSLIEAMDATVTAAGARLLEHWLAAPPLDIEELQRRQQTVGEFLEEPGRTIAVRKLLGATRDLTRILGRLQNRLCNPRELGGIRATLSQFPLLRKELCGFPGPHLAALAARLPTCDTLHDLLIRALAEELPAKLQDGRCIRQGYDTDLDRLHSLAHDNKTWVLNREREEQATTGIKNLKIKYNNAFGYFIEITKANLHLVPAHYIRKQTMTNAERFYTEDLKQKEREILHAEEQALAREATLFTDLVSQVLQEAQALQAAAAALAECDLLAAWAVLAREWDYCRPQLDLSNCLEVQQGRHPMIEQTLRREGRGPPNAAAAFVHNDCTLTASERQIALITGPNMAGKSTYIRQVALIVLMAQVGAWTPAKHCRIGLVDRIFSRVGASDELARGNSTFMVEMNETANILNNATPRSLIILDEIGRGTSTYDGLSIAWAVTEYLHDFPWKSSDSPSETSPHGPRTLFATHYHELTQLEASLSRLHNYCVAVKEWNDEIIFVRQVVPGAADRSYGIHVARLAGLPPTVLKRAQVLLEAFEADAAPVSAKTSFSKKSRCSAKAPHESQNAQQQLSLFSKHTSSLIF